MRLRIIAITAALSVLASAYAGAAERDACGEMLGCCMQADAATHCPAGTQRFERTCCCSIAPMVPATTAPLAVERPPAQAPLLPLAMVLAAGPAARGTRLPPAADRGPPPAARSLFAQHIALLL